MLLRDTARMLVGEAWLERRLFEVLGTWSTAATDPEVARLLAVESRHHGWRASVWDELVPVLHDVEPEVPSEFVALVDALGDLVEPLDQVASVVAILRERRQAHRDQLAVAVPVADAPVMRGLRLVVVDEEEDWRAADVLLRSLVQSGDDEVRVVTRQSHLVRLLIGG